MKTPAAGCAGEVQPFVEVARVARPSPKYAITTLSDPSILNVRPMPAAPEVRPSMLVFPKIPSSGTPLCRASRGPWTTRRPSRTSAPSSRRDRHPSRGRSQMRCSGRCSPPCGGRSTCPRRSPPGRGRSRRRSGSSLANEDGEPLVERPDELEPVEHLELLVGRQRELGALDRRHRWTGDREQVTGGRAPCKPVSGRACPGQAPRPLSRRRAGCEQGVRPVGACRELPPEPEADIDPAPLAECRRDQRAPLAPLLDGTDPPSRPGRCTQGPSHQGSTTPVPAPSLPTRAADAVGPSEHGSSGTSTRRCVLVVTRLELTLAGSGPYWASLTRTCCTARSASRRPDIVEQALVVRPEVGPPLVGAHTGYDGVVTRQAAHASASPSSRSICAPS